MHIDPVALALLALDYHLIQLQAIALPLPHFYVLAALTGMNKNQHYP